MIKMEIMRFEAITQQNADCIDRIDPGDVARYWVHYNWYWRDICVKHDDIDCRLLFVEQKAYPVGFIAYGQFYLDEALSQALPGSYEIMHLVVDVSQQHKGYGKQATLMAIEQLRQWPNCQEIVIAHHPDNLVAHKLYESIGFLPSERINDDGDPLMVYPLSNA